MASLKFYFDKRAKRKDSEVPLKVSITHKSVTALINLEVLLLPDQWEAKSDKVTNRPNKSLLNNHLKKRFLKIFGTAL